MGSHSRGSSQTGGDSPTENEPRYAPRHGPVPTRDPRLGPPPTREQQRLDPPQPPLVADDENIHYRRQQLEGLRALNYVSQSTAVTAGFPVISSAVTGGFAAITGAFQAIPLAPTEAQRGPRILSILRDPALRSALALVMSSVLSGGLGLVFWSWNAHHHSAATVGHVSAEVSAISFLAVIGGLNLATALPRFLPLAGWNTRRLLLASYASSTLAGLISVAIFMLTPLSSELVLDGTAGRWAFALCVVINSIFNFQDGGLVGFGKAAWVPVENLLVAIARLGLIAFLANAAFHSAAAGILWSWALPMGIAVLVVSTLSAGPLAARQAKVAPDLPTIKGLLSWVGIEAATTVVNASVTAFLPALVAWRLGAVQGAYVFIPWTIAIMAQLLLTNVFISMVREVITVPARAAVTIGRSIRFVGLVTVVGVLCCVFLGKFILLQQGAAYATYGSSFLRWVALSFPASAINLLFVAVCLIKIRPGLIFAANCVITIGTIGGLMTLGHGTNIGTVGAIYCGVTWLVAAASAIPAVRGIRAIIKETKVETAR
jgi:O-antigen/teichoic acid export membrane protein